MRYFDEERKDERLADTPYILPGFYIRIEAEHTVCLTVWLPSANNAFSSKSVVLQHFQLQPFLEDYMNDPEKVLKEIFEWTPKLKYSPSVLTLADLDL